MTISNYYVREYLHLYREYRKVINIFDAFLLYGKIEYTLGELRRDLSLDYQFHCALHDRLFNLSCRTCEKFGDLKSQNDFNDSQEGNAVQDSPFSLPSRRSAVLS